jgi:hypothetical protein
VRLIVSYSLDLTAPSGRPGWLAHSRSGRLADAVLAGWPPRSRSGWLAPGYAVLAGWLAPGRVSTLPLSYPKKWQFGGGR